MWETVEPDVLYVESYYSVAGYVLDQDWTLTQEPVDFWTHDETQS